MALIIDGVEIPENGGEVIMDGVSLDIVIMDGTTVWRKTSLYNFIGQGTSTLSGVTAGVYAINGGTAFELRDTSAEAMLGTGIEIGLDGNLVEGTSTIVDYPLNIVTTLTVSAPNTITVNVDNIAGSPIGAVVFDPATGLFSGEATWGSGTILTTNPAGELTFKTQPESIIVDYMTTEAV